MNGDRSYKHAVVQTVQGGSMVLLLTDGGEPAVYNDTPPAELHCAKMRERFPGESFRVLSFQVL